MDGKARQRPGRATSFDIAALAGVSQPTVSRALRGSPLVNERTRQRIEAIARQLNYTPDTHAASLRRKSSRTLAALFFEDPTPDDSLINPFFLTMLGPLTRACAGAGYDLLISFQEMAADWHVAFEDSRKADGILLLGYGDYTLYRARLDALVRQGTHFVRWGSVEPGEPGITVGSDNVGGGRQAGAHLIAGGRRAIAFLGDASDHYPEFRDRYEGLRAALADAGLPADAALQVDAITTEASGHAAVAALIARGVAFDAIFAASDLIAVGALRALAEAGRRVPEDVAVVGFDDLPAAALAHPPLTTVRQDYATAGRLLVATLIDTIADRAVPRQVIPTTLIARASSATV